MGLRHGQRTFIYLRSLVSAAVLEGPNEKLVATYRAFDMTCARNLAANERRWTGIDALPQEDARVLRIGRRVAEQIAGDVCYAFYAKATHTIKIGRTAQLMKRWAGLESASGMPLQLLLVWRTSNSRKLEADLFARYVEHRGIGEWFAADGVLPDLKDRAKRQVLH